MTTESNGLNIIDTRNGKIKYLDKTSGLAGDSLYAITGDKQGHMWISMLHEGLHEIDPGKGTIKLYNKQQKIDAERPLSIGTDSEGQIWVGSFSGLYVVNPEKQLTRSVAGRAKVPAMNGTTEAARR